MEKVKVNLTSSSRFSFWRQWSPLLGNVVDNRGVAVAGLVEGPKVGGGAVLAREAVARRSRCQASQNSSLGALNLLARAEGCASLGVMSHKCTSNDQPSVYSFQRRSEIKGIRPEEREVEEQLLHQKCMTIPRFTREDN